MPNRRRCPHCNKLKDRYGEMWVKREGMERRIECKECADQAQKDGHLVVSC